MYFQPMGPKPDSRRFGIHWLFIFTSIYVKLTRSLQVVDRDVPHPAGIGCLRGSNPIRAARIHADIQQSVGARDRATLTMRVVRLSCCFVWLYLARCQMVIPEQRDVSCMRGAAISAWPPRSCLLVKLVVVISIVRSPTDRPWFIHSVIA
jgi:hypothetical protein